VAPLLHLYLVQPAGAQSCVDCPWQIVLLPVIVQTGDALTVIVLLHVLTHPPAFVTVTEYVPAAVTVIQFVVAPLLHKYDDAPAGTHNCVDCPWQMELLPVIVQTGVVLTVTVLLHVLTHPPAVVVVTEYVPAAVTVIQFVVAPLLHKYDAAPAGTHSCVDCPWQIVLLPVIVQTGDALTVTVWLHVLTHPPALVTVTE
jgi:hypothetical protein